MGVGAGYWWGARTPPGRTRPRPRRTRRARRDWPAPRPERKILYYRNPMGLPDTSPMPKKDPMGMDYIAVYDGEETASRKQPGQDQRRQGAEARRAHRARGDACAGQGASRPSAASRSTSGASSPSRPSSKAGWSGCSSTPPASRSAKGQPLFEVYSPELVSAQREYAIAIEAVKALKDAGDDPQAGMKRLADSSLARLQELGHLRRAGAGAGAIRRGPAHAHVPLAGVRHRHGEEGRPGHALHARRQRSTRSPTCPRCG